MKLFEAKQSREEYLSTQVQRSKEKFGYCKVSIRDAVNYRRLIEGVQGKRVSGPVLCLGTRNGREVDVFRAGFFGGALSRGLHVANEAAKNGFTSRFGILDRIGRSRVDRPDERSVLGVELNPDGARPDVWTGSFDDMPKDWAGRFGVLYSNSFDQSQSPERTAKEWQRVVRRGGYIVFCFAPGAEPSQSDPVGDLHLADVTDLFDADVVYFRWHGSRAGYSEVILRVRS